MTKSYLSTTTLPTACLPRCSPTSPNTPTALETVITTIHIQIYKPSLQTMCYNSIVVFLLACHLSMNSGNSYEFSVCEFSMLMDVFRHVQLLSNTGEQEHDMPYIFHAHFFLLGNIEEFHPKCVSKIHFEGANFREIFKHV